MTRTEIIKGVLAEYRDFIRVVRLDIKTAHSSNCYALGGFYTACHKYVVAAGNIGDHELVNRITEIRLAAHDMVGFGTSFARRQAVRAAA